MSNFNPTEIVDSNKSALHKGKIGVLGIVFFVVAAAAPLVGMTGALPVAIVLGSGSGAPGAYLLVGLILLLFSVGYAAMSHRITNAGAFYAYVGRGLGVNTGVASAFVSVVAYLTVQWAIYGFFGAVMSGQMDNHFGIKLSWWVWSLLALFISTILSLLSIDIGVKVLGILLVAELASLFFTAFAVLLDGGPEGLNFTASFSLSQIFAGGLFGTAGIAFAFAFASFIGFEATAIYGEESVNPKKSVPRATYLAVSIITLIFVVVSFGMVTGMGSSKVMEETVRISTVGGVPLGNPAQVLFNMADMYVGSWMSTLMGWLVLSSLFAGLLAFQNSVSRYFFALGRSGVLPRFLSKVNGRGAPSQASILTSVFGITIIGFFAIRNLDPVLNLFYWFSGVAVIAIVLVEILVCIAVIAFFARQSAGENIFVRVIAPVLATIGLIYGAYLLMSRFALLAGTTAANVDPTQVAWAQSKTGTVLIAIPFITIVVGYLVAAIVKKKNSALQDFSEVRL